VVNVLRVDPLTGRPINGQVAIIYCEHTCQCGHTIKLRESPGTYVWQCEKCMVHNKLEVKDGKR